MQVSKERDSEEGLNSTPDDAADMISNKGGITRNSLINHRVRIIISSFTFIRRGFFGPGFRVYYTIQGREIIFLLAGGDKSSLQKDIAKARKLLEQLEV